MYILLTVVALITAGISAIIGMGGGIMLLACLFCFMPHADAIPTHAGVQLVSNSTRVLAYLRNVDWPVFRRFLLGSMPGSIIAVFLLLALGKLGHSEPYLKAGMGAYILVAAHLPKKKGPTSAGTWWDWPLMGLVAGSAALLVGAAGPLIAPLFARRDFVKERLIATKAMCQIVLHLAKIPAFAYIHYMAERGELAVVTLFRFRNLGLLAGCMAGAAILGTLLGKRLLRYVPEHTFVVLFKVALTVAGLKVLLVDGLWALWQR